VIFVLLVVTTRPLLSSRPKKVAESLSKLDALSFKVSETVPKSCSKGCPSADKTRLLPCGLIDETEVCCSNVLPPSVVNITRLPTWSANTSSEKDAKYVTPQPA
jgi:hypothetical protein